MSPKTEIGKEDKEDIEKECEMMRQVFSDFRDFFPEDKSEIDAIFDGETDKSSDIIILEKPLEPDYSNYKAIIRKTVVYCNRVERKTEAACVQELINMFVQKYQDADVMGTKRIRSALEDSFQSLVLVGAGGVKKRRSVQKGGVANLSDDQKTLISYAIECIKFFYKGDDTAVI